MSKSFGEIFNAGNRLQSPVITIVAARVAVEAAINIMGENLRCASSMANIMPVRGAPVAAANPPQAPPVMVYLSHALLPFAKRSTAPLPTEQPICTFGPSFPRGTPTKNVSRVDVNIPSKLLIHLNGINPRRMAREFGIPLPRMIGKNFIIRKEMTLTAAAIPSNMGKNAGFVRADSYINEESI